MKKYLIVDLPSIFKINQNNLYIDIANPKVDFKKLFDGVDIFCFKNIFDIISSNNKIKIPAISKILLGENFNPHTTFDFAFKFPGLKQIICQNKECFENLKEIYNNKKIKVLYKPIEVNFC